jgi:membrane dipeptidase
LPREKADELRAARRAIDKRYPLKRATFEDFMTHVLHALKVVGPDHVGIGADWDGGGGVDGMEDVAALPKITQRLLEEGYTAVDLEKIWGGNVLRLLRAAEDHAAQR